jgi:hypothetical protein
MHLARNTSLSQPSQIILLLLNLLVCYNKDMKKKPMTVQEFARKGGLARAKKYTSEQLAKWGKLGGRPRKQK